MDEYPDSRPFSPFQEPLEVTAARNKERANALKEMPLMEKRLAELDERIKNTDSVQQILAVKKAYADLKLTSDQVLVIMDVVRQQLESERSLLQDMISAYKR